MNQYRFNIEGSSPEYTGPPCPRVVKCEDCNRIMEAPLLGDAKKCCLSALSLSLSNWLNDDYAPHMNPSPFELAMAGVSLDGLMYDMGHGHTVDSLHKNPEDLASRDEYMTTRMIERLLEQGFDVKRRKDGSVDASHPDDEPDYGWEDDSDLSNTIKKKLDELGDGDFDWFDSPS